MRGRFAFAFAAAATSWCLLLIVGVFVYPSYSGSVCRAGPDRSMNCVSRTATNFETNGWQLIALLGAVAFVSLVVSVALHRVCTTGSRGAVGLAWTGIGLLSVFSYLTVLSIGFVVVPAAVLLIVGAVLTPKPAALARQGLV